MTGRELLVLPPTGPNKQPCYVLMHDGALWRVSANDPVDLVKERADTFGQLKSFVDAVGSVGTQEIYARIKNAMGKLYETVVPSGLRSALRKTPGMNAPPLLRIYAWPEVDWIPWELMFDWQAGGNQAGDGKGAFLGLDHRIVRWPIPEVELGRMADLDKPGKKHVVERVYNLLARNALSETQETVWGDTFSFQNQAGWEHRFPDRRPGGVHEYVGAFDLTGSVTSPDILHFTCHGGEDKNGKPVWLLDHLSEAKWAITVYPDQLQGMAAELGQARPLVFANACGNWGDSNSTTVDESDGLSFGRQFIQAGASAYVGAFARVGKDLAIQFAAQFYRELLVSGRPLAEALWATKAHFLEQMPADPSWLFYCLYGQPDIEFALPD